MGRKGSTPSFLEEDGQFFTKPCDISNYFSHYFSNKIKGSYHHPDGDDDDDDGLSSKLIRGQKIRNKSCKFIFKNIDADKILKLLQVSKENPQVLTTLI